MSVSFDDGAIHARSESKVIGIHDQTTHRVSLAGRKRERGHQGFAPRGSTGVGSTLLPIPIAKAARLTVFSHVAYTRNDAVRTSFGESPRHGVALSELKGVGLANIRGRLAQLVRAPALQAGGRRFESCTAHQVLHIEIRLRDLCMPRNPLAVPALKTIT